MLWHPCQSSIVCGQCLQQYNHLVHSCPKAEGIHCPACCRDDWSDYHEAYKTKRSANEGCHSCRRLSYSARCLELHASTVQDGKACNPCVLHSEDTVTVVNCWWVLKPNMNTNVNGANAHRATKTWIGVSTDGCNLLNVVGWLASKGRRPTGSTYYSCTEGEDEEAAEPYRTPLLVFWETEAMSDTGLHVDCLVVGMTHKSFEVAAVCIVQNAHCSPENYLQCSRD